MHLKKFLVWEQFIQHSKELWFWLSVGWEQELEENITRCCNSPILQEVLMSYFGESPSFNFNRTYVAEIFDYSGRFLLR